MKKKIKINDKIKPQKVAHGHSCCTISSRRQFISQMGLASGGLLLLNSSIFSYSTNKILGKPLLPGDKNVKPRISIAFSRQKDEYYMGWPGAAYDQKASQNLYTEILNKAADQLGIILDIETEPLRDSNHTNRFLKKVKDQKSDGALITCMNLNDGWPAIQHFIDRREKNLPTIIFAPRGTLFTPYLRQYGEAPNCFLGSTVDPEWLGQGLRMLKSVWQMDNTHVAVIHNDEMKEEKLEPIGTTLHHIPLDRFPEAYHATEGSEEAKAIAYEYMRKAKMVLEPSEQDVIEAARTYVANRHIMDEFGCHAVTMDCLGLIGEKITPPPCMAYHQLLNEKTCGCCERDITGTLTLMLSSYLFNKPGFLHNPVPDSTTQNYGGAHCVSPTLLDGFEGDEHPLILRTHHESDWGVATQVILRENQSATIMKFSSPNTLWAATGTILGNVDTQPHDGVGGCRTGFSMVMDDVKYVSEIRGHHNVLVYGKHIPQLRSWGKLAGIKTEHITGGNL